MGDNDGVPCAPDWHWITVTMTNEIDMFRSSDIAQPNMNERRNTTVHATCPYYHETTL